MAVCAWLLKRDEHAIAMGLHLLPGWYPDCPFDHLAEHEGCAEEMDELHLRKIDLADEVFIVDFRNYIGESTAREVGYAAAAGKIIRRFTQDHVGSEVCVMLKNALSGTIHERICRVCGCSDYIPCPGGCSWVEEDLCSTCGPAIEKRPTCKFVHVPDAVKLGLMSREEAIRRDIQMQKDLSI